MTDFSYEFKTRKGERRRSILLKTKCPITQAVKSMLHILVCYLMGVKMEIQHERKSIFVCAC